MDAFLGPRDKGILPIIWLYCLALSKKLKEASQPIFPVA
jgi:hypothetical protein